MIIKYVKHKRNIRETLTVLPGSAAGLDYSPVKVKVNVSALLHLALDKGIGVIDVHKFSIRRIQSVVLGYAHVQRHGRVQSGYSVHRIRPDGYRRKVGQLRSQRKTDQVDVSRSCLQDSVQQQPQATSHESQIVNSLDVTRTSGQVTVVYVEQVVAATGQVFWE